MSATPDRSELTSGPTDPNEINQNDHADLDETSEGRQSNEDELSDLTEKQRRILAYLHEHAAQKTYFKSRLIARELDMTPKEVGANLRAIQDSADDITVEKWGYSSSTTWQVTA